VESPGPPDPPSAPADRLARRAEGAALGALAAAAALQALAGWIPPAEGLPGATLAAAGLAGGAAALAVAVLTLRALGAEELRSLRALAAGGGAAAVLAAHALPWAATVEGREAAVFTIGPPPDWPPGAPSVVLALGIAAATAAAIAVAGLALATWRAGRTDPLERRPPHRIALRAGLAAALAGVCAGLAEYLVFLPQLSSYERADAALFLPLVLGSYAAVLVLAEEAARWTPTGWRLPTLLAAGLLAPAAVAAVVVWALTLANHGADWGRALRDLGKGLLSLVEHPEAAATVVIVAGAPLGLIGSARIGLASPTGRAAWPASGQVAAGVVGLSAAFGVIASQSSFPSPEGFTTLAGSTAALPLGLVPP